MSDTRKVGGTAVERPNSPPAVLMEPRAVPFTSRLGGGLRVIFVVFCLVAVSVGIARVLGRSTAAHPGSSGLATLLAIASLTATVAYLTILLALHVLPTGYNPVHHAVSDYAVGRYGALFDVALYVSSVGVLALAFGLLRSAGSPPLAARDLIFLLVIPLARIGMTLFPTSLEGRPMTRTGLIHYAFAVAAFTFTYLAISGMTSSLKILDAGQWPSAPLGWAASIVGPALGLVVITMLRPLRRIFGLFERVFLVSTNIWFALAALVLIVRPG